MPTKRVPLRRSLKHKVTPEAIALFRRGEELRWTYEECLRGECVGDGIHHCRECAEYLDTIRALEWGIFKFPPWHVSVFDPNLADGADVPGYMHNMCSGPTWPEAKALRKALLEAVKAK